MKVKLVLIISVAVLLIIGLVIGLVILFAPKEKQEEEPKKEEEQIIVPEKELSILNPNSTTRPIAVMINNHADVQPYQSALNDAYLVYEIIVEGGITRMMAVFKDANSERVGSIRSARHYFLDYALENDALYTHHGWSPQAQRDISSLGVNNLHGNYYWRENLPIAYEHTMFTSMTNLWEDANRYGYRITSDSETLLNYDVDSLQLIDVPNNQQISSVLIKYSSYQTNEWVYNEESKMFEKYSNGTLRVDYVTKNPVVAKNIITYQVNNYSIDNYGRQTIENIGSGSGYFISEGYSIPITWNKDSRSNQTKYYYENGDELVVNDGITHIQIQPTSGLLEFRPVLVDDVD